MLKVNIDEAIARIKDWEGKEISYETVPGGLTNPNYKVTVDGENWFLKIPGEGTDFIDRDNCHMANLIASETGVGPKAGWYDEETGVEVVAWMDGYRGAAVRDMYDEELNTKMVQAIAAFHNVEGMKLPLVQSVFDQTWDMRARAMEGPYLPPWHDKMEFLTKWIENAYSNFEYELKPCHNDYYTNNIMYNEETKEMKIIDFEYASMNDPYYDLAIYTMGVSNEEHDIATVKAYLGSGWDEVAYARYKLNSVVGEIKWSYWSLYQNMCSDLFDYMNWYGPKVARLQKHMIDPRLEYWVNLITNKKPFYTE